MRTVAYSIRRIARHEFQANNEDRGLASESGSRNLVYVKRILLADDSALVRRTLRRLFEDSGWSVCGEASNGQEVITKAQELRPDIVVLDLSMPLMNGLTAARILKETIPETYLVLFTAFGTLLTTDELKRAGFSASISKGDAGKLVNTAQTLLKAA